ncbi:anti-sigma-I factor RsgI2 [Scomber scombrus]|uniref:Anti-sigma-I factor RsgI2 n=1 Tax=Scomber scombrus TaxID=13677 RepID=A0AAV1PUQ2_SCOSC
MMENKLWIALCALLLFINVGSADHDTNTGSVPDNKNLTNTSTLQPPTPHFESHTPTSHVAPISTAASPTHAIHTAPAATSTKTPPLNNSTPLLPDTITTSSQPTHTKTHSPISSPAPKLPGTTSPKTKPVPANTTASTHSTSTSSTSPSQKPPNTQPPTLAPQPNTTKSDSEAHSKTTISLPISTSAQAKAHDDNPSQLNVGGNTAHESPTLDPLLAGLVSAFIITAVIITLLLFLKLRRRDNRPEFRRLQDLPMDDMMEDTPLSMYSY